MNYRILMLIAATVMLYSCKKEETEIAPIAEEPTYIQDNIFGCPKFEVMEIDDRFFAGSPPIVEVFQQYFVYGMEYQSNGVFVVRDGFHGPILQRHEMRVKGLAALSNELVICAEEGVFSLVPSGEMTKVSDDWCYAMTLEGQDRVLVHGYFEQEDSDDPFGIYQYKNHTISAFVDHPFSFDCSSFKMAGGVDRSLYLVSCQREIAHYKNGVVQAEFDEIQTPFFPALASVYEAHDGGLITIGQQSNEFYRMYKLVGAEWLPIYDLTYDSTDTSEKSEKVFYDQDANMFVNGDYVYAFCPNIFVEGKGITRFKISGNQQMTWDDIDLIQIPTVETDDLIDIVRTSDGHVFAVCGAKIVKLTCD